MSPKQPLEVHSYKIVLEVGAPHELTDKRLAAVAARMQMLLTNMGYWLWQDEDGACPLRIESHSVEAIDNH